MKRSILKLSLLFLIVVMTLGLSSEVLAQSTDEIRYNRYAEEWVSYQIATGKVADLAQHYPNPDDRVIRGSFVAALLQSKSSVVAQNGVSIKNATIIGDLFLQHTNISFPVTFEGLIFNGYVSFCRDHFYSLLSITRSIFNSSVNFCAIKSEDSIFLTDSKFGASVDFTGAEVRGDLGLQRTSFASLVQFGAAKVQSSLFLDDAAFTNLSQTIVFDIIHVDKSVFLNRATFYGSARFMDAYIGYHFAADDVKFTSPDGAANFENMFVGKSIYLNRAIFDGTVNFSNVNAGDDFIASNAQFNSMKEAVFPKLKVGKIMYLTEAVFAGPVDFTYMDIGSLIKGDGARFNSQDGSVNFGQTQVGEYIFLESAQFAGPADFRFTHIGKNFEFDDAKFTNPDGLVYFGDMRVDFNLIFHGASFAGPADFNNVQVGSSINANDTQFLNEEARVNFFAMRVEKSASFVGAIFMGPVDFTYGEIGLNFDIGKTQFRNPQAKIDFSEITIAKSLFMPGVVFNGSVSFDYIDINNVMDLSDSRFNNSKEQTISLADMNVGGYIFLNRTAFSGPVSFSRTVTKGLFATDVTWPKEQGDTNVTGLIYQEIDVRDSKDDKANFISLLEQSPFEIQSYQRLEKYYRDQGYPSPADYTYMKGKQRERKDGLTWTYWRWWWNLFLDIFVLYGLDPLRVLAWFLFFVIFGYFVFRKKEKMTAVVETDRPYRPFLYSLDLFVPIIDLGYAKLWIPSSERKIARIYAKIHQSLAWVLVPIALLAIAGVIK